MKKLIFLLLISTCFAVNTNTAWIENGEIEALWTSWDKDQDDTFAKAKADGFNTILLKVYNLENPFWTASRTATVLEWAVKAKANGMHFFVVLDWQSVSVADGLPADFDTSILDDGTESLMTSPFDDDWWTEWTSQFVIFATYSLDEQYQIDGILYDTELYGTANEPAAEQNYFIDSANAGYGDTPWFQYLTNRDVDDPSKPANARKAWLADQSLLDDYYLFLKEVVALKALALKGIIHGINNNLILGGYPHPDMNNWFKQPLAINTSSVERKVLVLGIHSYGYTVDGNGDGYTLIPEGIQATYTGQGIQNVYSAGYLWYKYDGVHIKRNLEASIDGWDGYWGFRGSLLYDPGNDSLTDQMLDDASTMRKYIRSISSPVSIAPPPPPSITRDGKRFKRFRN